jgi:cytochrome c553
MEATMRTSGAVRLRVGSLVAVLLVGGCVAAAAVPSPTPTAGEAAGLRVASGPTATAVVRQTGSREAEVLRGRTLLVNHACGGCHGGGGNPAAEGYLAGMRSPDEEFLIGACARTPGAQPCFRTRARNLTPDNATGLGRFSERQIFNALRYGLRPGETPDVEITSTVPGQGNHPLQPKYLAPPMPWPEWRHMSDQELRDIAAYLKLGVRAVRNRVPDSEGPPDFWASAYTVEKIGPYPLPPFPTAREQRPVAETKTQPQ